MLKLSRAVAAATLAAVTAVPAVAATAAPASAAPAVAASASERPAKAIRLSTAKPGTHFGLAGNKITATVRQGKGKVKFFLDGAAVAKSKIKRGKAVYTMPADLAPGSYKIKATYKRAKATTTSVVWDSALNVSVADFTISAATPSYQLPTPSLAGQVKYKGKFANGGYVDVYLNGNVKGGNSGPDYCCMAGVNTDGTFSFSSSFLTDAQERGVGTWTYRAFYTETASFADYIYSQPLTVTVTP